MKANEAPEKIYIFENPASNEFDDIWLSSRNFKKDIEYIRKDTFIEKACEWLKNSTYGYLTEKWGETELDRETLAVDFANYMKGE